MGAKSTNYQCWLIPAACLLRLGLLCFSIWQDETRWPDGQLRFTDVDYDVFTDASKALIAGEDIYEARPTYRYSPVVALILSPGHLLLKFVEHPSWALATLAPLFGKLVFIGADIYCAIIQRRIILLETKVCLLFDFSNTF